MIPVGPFQLNYSVEKCAMVPQLSERKDTNMSFLCLLVRVRGSDHILLRTQMGKTSIPSCWLFYQRINSALLLLWRNAWQLNELGSWGVINGGHLENMSTAVRLWSFLRVCFKLPVVWVRKFLDCKVESSLRALCGVFFEKTDYSIWMCKIVDILHTLKQRVMYLIPFLYVRFFLCLF